jgi:hypothetical protein
MSIMKRVRGITSEQQRALRALDEEERAAIELEELEAEHVVAEDAYLRRRDRILGREVPERYEEIDAARALLGGSVREREKRFERRRMAILAGHVGGPEAPEQMTLLPGQE